MAKLRFSSVNTNKVYAPKPVKVALEDPRLNSVVLYTADNKGFNASVYDLYQERVRQHAGAKVSKGFGGVGPDPE